MSTHKNKKANHVKKNIHKILEDYEGKTFDMRFSRLSVKFLKHLNKENEMFDRLENLKNCNTGQDQHYFKKAWAIRADSGDRFSREELTQIVRTYLGDMMFVSKLCHSNYSVLSPSLLIESLLLSRGSSEMLEFIDFDMKHETVEEYRRIVEEKIGLDQFFKKQLLYCISNLKDIRSKYKVKKKTDDFKIRVRLMKKLYEDEPVKLKTVLYLETRLDPN